ncbi:hypothetical protein ES703_96098 [subsurface metagenome]
MTGNKENGTACHILAFEAIVDESRNMAEFFFTTHEPSREYVAFARLLSFDLVGKSPLLVDELNNLIGGVKTVHRIFLTKTIDKVYEPTRHFFLGLVVKFERLEAVKFHKLSYARGCIWYIPNKELEYHDTKTIKIEPVIQHTSIEHNFGGHVMRRAHQTPA